MTVRNVITVDEGSWNDQMFVLRQKSEELPASILGSEYYWKTICDMLETLYSTSQGVGLAAPQIGLMSRMIVIDIKGNGVNPLVLVNPCYTAIGDKMIESKESCLSVPGFSATVMRYAEIMLSYVDCQGEEKQIAAQGFLARVLQHEIDHLNGIMYIDRMVEGTLRRSHEDVARLTNVALASLGLSERCLEEDVAC